MDRGYLEERRERCTVPKVLPVLAAWRACRGRKLCRLVLSLGPIQRVSGSPMESRSLKPIMRIAALLALTAGLPGSTIAQAQDFYRGKTITLFAGMPPGGGIDSEMRL